MGLQKEKLFWTYGETCDDKGPVLNVIICLWCIDCSKPKHTGTVLLG